MKDFLRLDEGVFVATTENPSGFFTEEVFVETLKEFENNKRDS